MTAASLADHLWQSTMVAAVCALLVGSVGKRQPSVRHAIWLTASLKFLIPFSILATLGRAAAAWAWPSFVAVAAPMGVQALGRPFDVTGALVSGAAPSSTGVGEFLWIAIAVVWAAGSLVRGVAGWRDWRRAGRIADSARPLTHGREVEALARVGARLDRCRSLSVRESTAACEPAIVGIRRPVLIWPAGLSAHLDDDAMEAIILHEACHVRRRDNLAAVMHIVVETLFWFHPLVWWIGARMVDAREHACDDAVLSLGTRSETYAESLLHVCRFCLRAPMPFAAGIAGSSLARRMEAIMTYRSRVVLGPARRVVLAGAVIIMTAGPIVLGAVTGDSVQGSEIAAGSAVQIDRATAPGVTAPTVLSSPRPRYPAAAMIAKLEGVVTLEAVVKADGTVGDVRVLKSLDTTYGLDDAAMAAARDWRFRPAIKNGIAVPVWVTLEISFRMDRQDRFGAGAYTARTPGLVLPTAIRTAQPQYTSEAMADHLQGLVEIEAVVEADGTVGEARITRSLDKVDGLDEQAMLALGKWTFRPATLNGQPVRAVVTMTFTFKMK
jgi:TonB family protein